MQPAHALVLLECIQAGKTPPLTPQKKLEACLQIFFPRFIFVLGGGEGELQENFKKDALFYEGTQKWQKNINTELLSQRLLSIIVGK